MKLGRRSLLISGVATIAGWLVGCSKSAPTETPSSSVNSPRSTPRPASPSPSPTPTVVDPLPEGVVNALVFGTDAREKESLQGNADAILIAQISADRKKLTLVSIARDSYVAIGGGRDKVNAAFPMGGTERLVETVSNLFGGLPIHLTAQANFNGFINITRWLGGIRVFNKHASTTTVISTGRLVEFPGGEIVLENTDGLIYARQRKELPLGDLDRAERHRALIAGMLKGLQAMLGDSEQFGDIATKIFDNTKVTGPLASDQVPALAAPLKQIDTDAITSLMVPISRFDTINGASVNIVNDAKMQELAAAMRDGTVDDYVAKYGTDYTPGV